MTRGDKTKHEGAKTVAALFSESTVREICTTLLARAMTLTPAELQGWEHSPEEYVNEELRADYQHQIKVPMSCLSHINAATGIR
jgi:hypothetical protein